MNVPARRAVVVRDMTDEFERLLRLSTFPIAAKMLRAGEDLPEGAIRPVRDLGHQFNVCQSFALSRRAGQTIAVLKEDNWCPGPVAGYGIEHPTDYYLKGHQQQNTFRDLATSRTWSESLPRLDIGKYAGIVSAPLALARFEPEVVIAWVDSAQLALLLMAHSWGYGKDVVSRLSARGACIFEIVPALRTGDCQLSVPCLGERQRAMTQDCELVFSIPWSKFELMLDGMRHFHTIGYGLPVNFTMRPQYERSPAYKEWARLMRMDPPPRP